MAKTLSLVELTEGEHSPAEAIATFRHYAESGAAISPHTIKAIFGRIHLTPQEMDRAYEHMQAGMVSQITQGKGIAGLEYLQAMNYLAQMIAETMAAGDATRSQSDNPLARIKSELIMAHSHKSKLCLERAVKAFQNYALQTNLTELQTNPTEFGQGAVDVNLTQPGLKGIFTKSYNLARYGGSIVVYDYLMGIHATDSLEVEEKIKK